MTDEALKPVDKGRLLQLKLHRNASAREAAQNTVRQRPDYLWQGRYGSRHYGLTVVATRKVDVKRCIDEHYNDRAMEILEALKLRWLCGFCGSYNHPSEDVCPSCHTDRPQEQKEHGPIQISLSKTHSRHQARANAIVRVTSDKCGRGARRDPLPRE